MLLFQGNCVWTNVTGRQVTLTDTSILHLSDIERKILQKVSLAKLQALNIGCHIQLPSGESPRVLRRNERFHCKNLKLHT